MNKEKAREEKLGRIIRITWKRFSDYLSNGAVVKEKPNFRMANSFQPKLSTRNDHKEVCR